MMGDRSVSDQQMAMAFAEGELPRELLQQFRARIRQDPSLWIEVAAQRRQLELLNGWVKACRAPTWHRNVHAANDKAQHGVNTGASRRA